MRKLFLTFLALIVQLCAWAFEGDYYKYTISPSTGTANKTSGWLTSWVSTEKVDGTLDANGLKLPTTSKPVARRPSICVQVQIRHRPTHSQPPKAT